VEENNNELFSITTMPPTRPADYYLCYLDGCVFIDFNKNQMKQIQLVRISFDGYGCCNVQNATPMEPNDAKAFKAMMKAQMLDQSLLETIVKKTIAANKALLWEDALARYDLL
jgi:hypothetical protein